MPSPPNTATHILVPLALLAAAGWLAARDEGGGPGWLVVACLVWLTYVIGVSRLRRRQFQRALELIRPHAQTLAIRRLQTVHVDAYGLPVTKAWEIERQGFFDRVVAPRFSSLTAFQRLDLLQEIERLAQVPMPATASVPTDPIAYEQFCADILERNGWSARRTKASGDQGVDIVAERPGLRVVLQCKLYGRPVGNGAVQEAIAGAQFERAHLAAVVSNAVFTPAAQQLATTAGVLLLHHEQLPMLAELATELRASAGSA